MSSRLVLSAGVLLALVTCHPAGAQPPEAFGVAGPTAPEIVKPPVSPLSWRLGVTVPLRVPTASLNWIDNTALLVDDVMNPPSCKALRYGRGHDVKLPRSGAWLTVPAGGRLWVMDVASPSALGLRLHLDGLSLPEGASVVVYNPSDPTEIFGPYEGVGPVGDGQVWAPTVFSNIVRVECYLPRVKTNPTASPLKIDRVQHVYRDMRQGGADPMVDVGTCHNDVTCSPTWANTALACGGIGSVSGADSLYCSGQLLATTNGDQTPYWLTANHCLSTQAAATSGEFFWRFQTTVCNGAAPALTTVPRSAVSTLISTNATSDYTLLVIEGTLPSGLFFAGWTGAAASDGTAVACIHHPDGTYKRISFGNKASNPTCATSPSHIRSNWTSACTEPGSSGAGLFRVDTQQLIGQLHCGPSSCTATPANMNDAYGSFAVTLPSISASLAAGSDDALEPNDSCAAARSILSGNGTSTNNSLVVKKVNEDWYKYTVPTGSALTVSLAFTHANGDIDVQLFGTCGGGVLAQSVSTTDAETVTITNAGAQQDYFVRVFLSGTDTRNAYNMTSTVAAPLTNNACAQAIAIGPGTYTGSTATATADGSVAGAGGCASNVGTSPDVWYSITTGITGTVAIDSCGSADDTVVSVHSACPGTTANTIVCNDDSAAVCGTNSLQSALSFTATAGVTYRVRVGGFVGASGNYTLHVTFPVPPNNACAGATTIFAGSTPFDTRGATTDGLADTLCTAFGSSQVDNDIWYRFVPTCTGFVDVGTCATNFDTRVAVYSGVCPSAANTAIACNDDSATCGGGALGSFLTFNGVSGQPYYIRVGGFNGAVGSGTLTVVCRAACAADIASSGNPDPQAGPDGFVTGEDFDLFVMAFNTLLRRTSNNALIADITDGSGTGSPDGFVTGTDFDRYVVLYFTSCN